ncbi:MAG: polymer-forming cytoskeletal protein [candidate division NC10 bacterium]|nr:polymer-forming cytoskeletal protein [candidate division NC10 bacterium]
MLIGKGITVRGEITGTGDLHVAGRMEGKVNLTGTFVVEAGAEVEADVNATAIVVGGQVRGNLMAASRIELLPSGRLHGTCRARSLVVREGALLNGKVSAGAPAERVGGDEELAERVRRDEARAPLR